MATLGQSMLRVSSKKPAEPEERIAVNPVKEDTDGHGSPTVRVDASTDVEPQAMRDLTSHLKNLAAINQFPVQPYPEPPPTNVSVLGSADNQPNPRAFGQMVFADPTREEMQSMSPLATEEAEETRRSQAFLREGFGIERNGGVADLLFADEATPPAQRYISRVLRTNRFSGLNDTTRLTDPQGDDRALNRHARSSADQKRLGVYDGNIIPAEGRHLVHPPTGKDALRDGSRATADEVQLRNVALRLMVEATGHKKAAESLAADTSPSNLRSQGRKTLLPSGVQLGGGRVDGNRLQAGAGVTSTASSARRAESLGYAGEFVDSGKSVGALTSPIEQFGDGLGGGLFFQALAGAVALLGVSSLFSLFNFPKRMTLAEVSPSAMGKGIHRLVDTPGNTEVNSSADGGGAVGRAIGQAASRIADSVMPSFQVPNTTHAFDDCIAAGIKSFYGIDGSGGGFSSIANAPGYYASIMRTVVRDLEGVASSARQVRSRPLQGLQAFADALAASNTFRFLTVMIGLGDAALSSADGSQGPMGSADNRLSSGMLETAVSARTGLRLLPDSMVSAGIVSQLLGNSSAMEGITAARSSMGNLTMGRIGPETVRTWESRLDAEYFPLTMHDLRTHELVSLNAFVTDLQDSFQPSYKNTSGFGRVDDVLTYEKTTRQIQLGFVMVAANPTDHDVMWDTINKIVTMVYPQWSKGRLIKKGETSFRVPFSQVITASPMIRLRFGETITGNYTRFGALRLFGAGEATQGASVLGTANGTTSRLSADRPGGDLGPIDAFEAGEVQLVRDAARVAPFRFDGFSLNDNVDQSVENASDVFRSALLSAAGEALSRTKNGFAPRDQVVLLRDLHVIVDPVADGDGPTGLANRIRRRRRQQLNTKVSVPAGTLCEVVGSHPDDSVPRLYKLRFADGEFIADHHSLALDTPSIIATELNARRIEEGDTTATTGYDPNRFADFQRSVQQFFNADPSKGPTNPIVRAFESSMSKGLAGFITSLSFDYSDSTYETAPGSRAPITVKVSMGFTPIHDIAPGLDADGYNRAPVYQVGRVSRLLAGMDGRNSIDFRGDGSEPIVPQSEQEARAEALRQINEERADEQERIDRATQGARDARARAEAEAEAARRAAAARAAASRAAAIRRQAASADRLAEIQAELNEAYEDYQEAGERLETFERANRNEVLVVGADVAPPPAGSARRTGRFDEQIQQQQQAGNDALQRIADLEAEQAALGGL